MIVPVIAISNLELTRQIYSEAETNGVHAHTRDRVMGSWMTFSYFNTLC